MASTKDTKTFKEVYKDRNERYVEYVEKVSPKQITWLSLFNAFWIGGLICCLGQFFYDMALLIFEGIDKTTASNISLVILIFLTALFTGIGWFDKLAYYGGGGSFLPITGFANSICSAAIEFKTEGYIFGTTSKFFTVAGPVIVNGVFGAFIVGLIYYFLGLAGVV